MNRKGTRLLLCLSVPLAGKSCDLSGFPLLFLLIASFIAFYFMKEAAKREELSFRRFLFASFYMEQLLYSFERNKKVTAALEEIRILMDEQLLPFVDQALSRIKSGLGGDDIFGYGLSAVGEFYSCRIMEQIHRFLIQAEELGGDTKESIPLLKAGVSAYEEEIKLFEEKRRVLRGKLCLCVLLSLFICVTIMKILPDWALEDKRGVLSGLLTCLLLSFLLLLVYFSGCASDPEGKEKARESVYALVWNEEALSLPDRIRFLMQRERVYKEASAAFSDWMFDMLLRMQSGTVTNAVRGSIECADPVLVLPLWKLLTMLKEDPLSPAPYLAFLSQTKNMQVRAVMLELFAAGHMGSDAVRAQFRSLLSQNLAMQKERNRLRAEDRLSALGFLAAVPMLLCMLFLAAVMLIVLLGFLSDGGLFSGSL